MRAFLYRLARILGDVQAVTRGRVAERLWNRGVGRLASMFTRRLWR